jgi:superkiller protein 3
MIRALVELLGNFYSNGDFTHVEAIARSILTSIPDDHVSLQILGLVYYRTGRIGEAVGMFNRVIHRQCRVPKAKRKLGDDYLSRGEYAASAACHQEATRLNADFAPAWNDLGDALLDLRRYDEAIGAYRSALSAQPECTEAMAGLGVAGLRVDDLAAAEEGYGRLRTIEPENADAFLGLGRVYRRRRDFAAAKACFRRARGLREAKDSGKNRQ